MFRIGEFSKLVRVSARMLRYYDKCGLLRPAEIDRFTGYRMYSSTQIPILMRIVAFRDMGFGVEEIEEVLPHYNDEAYMHKILERKCNEIYATIDVEKAKLKKIAAMSSLIKKEYLSMIYDVELKTLPAVKVVSLQETIPAYDKEQLLWNKMGEFMAKEGIACGMGGYSIYHDDEYKESDVNVEIAVPVDKPYENRDGFIYKELEAISLAATIRFSGPYENYTPAMEKLTGWMEQNGYEFAGLIRGLAIMTPADQSNPENYLTELQVPVRRGA